MVVHATLKRVDNHNWWSYRTCDLKAEYGFECKTDVRVQFSSSTTKHYNVGWLPEQSYYS